MPRGATGTRPRQDRPYDRELTAPERERPIDRPAQSGVAGRRTVTIQGRGADRAWAPTGERRRPTRRPHEREGFRPDRAAMWAVMLGLVLVLVAATSSHAAVRAHVCRRASGVTHAAAAPVVRHAAAAHVVRHAGAPARGTGSPSR